MIMNYWENISYSVQLLGACFLLMLMGNKRKTFLIRSVGAFIMFNALTFIMNMFYHEEKFGITSYLYWAVYILVCIIFVKIGLMKSWLQSIYCAACACAIQHIAYDLLLIFDISGYRSGWLKLFIYIITYTLFLLFFVKEHFEDGEFVFHWNTLFPIITIIFLVWILSILEEASINPFSADFGHRIIYRIIDALCCFYVLWGQVNQKKNYKLLRELETVNYMLSQQKKQYDFTSETIGNINRKCHDLKYQIRSLRKMTDEHDIDSFLNGLESDIMIYDTAMKTGNQALDIVLMEKGLYCKEHQIQWTCMVDGFQLDFMKNEDIYSILGNAFDNAIEAVMKLSDVKSRIISVKMLQQKQLLTIQIQNFYVGELFFADGLPITTHTDKKLHGYGMKSMRYTVEKYNGTITVNASDHIFKLQILLPMPQKII